MIDRILEKVFNEENNLIKLLHLHASSLVVLASVLILKQKLSSALPNHPTGHDVDPFRTFSAEHATVELSVNTMVTGLPNSGTTPPLENASRQDLNVCRKVELSL